MSKFDITVFIPTYYGEDYLEDLLKMVFKQKIDKTYEVLVYDTSSKDKTPEIISKYAKKHKNLRYKTITKKEYGHGKTRDEAARDAKGDIVVYLSQDATPAHDRWLYEMTKPFELSDKVVGVLGKQDPRPKAFPLLKREIVSVFNNFGHNAGTSLFYKDDFVKDQQAYDFICFYSDVNSAARKEILTGEIPYKHVAYAEDQLFGRDLIDAGYIKAYAPRGNVNHSNEFKLSEYKNRMFDETMGLRKVGIPVQVPSLKLIIKEVVKNTIKDFIFTIKDNDYSFKRKIYYIFTNPIYNIEKWKGVRAAAKVDIEDEESIKMHSLEAKKGEERGE